MILIDNIRIVKELHGQSSFVIQDENIFLENNPKADLNRFSVFGMIENVAQTSLAFMQLYLSEKNDADDEVFGYISTIQELFVHDYADCGQTIWTEVHAELVYTSDFLKICNITASVASDRKLMDTAMKMILQKNN